MTSGGWLRLLAPSAPTIALAVGVLTFGCAAPALTDRPVSGVAFARSRCHSRDT